MIVIVIAFQKIAVMGKSLKKAKKAQAITYMAKIMNPVMIKQAKAQVINNSLTIVIRKAIMIFQVPLFKIRPFRILKFLRCIMKNKNDL